MLWHVLANRQRYGLYFLGSGFSNIGLWCQTIAATLLVYRLTGSTFAVGLVTAFQFVWPVLLGPWAGMLADRYDRRTILSATLLSGAAISTALSAAIFSGVVNLPLTYAAVTALGLLSAVQSPAGLALVPLIVDREDLDIGLSLNSTQFNIARAVGPILGTALVGLFGVGAAFLFNGVSYLTYVVALRLIRPAEQALGNDRHPLGGFGRVLRSSPVLLPLLTLTLMVGGASDIVQTLGPVRSVEISGTDRWTGWFVTAFGVGAVVGAVVLLPVVRRFRRRLPWTILVQAGGAVLFAVSASSWAALLGAFLTGGGFLLSSNRILAAVQQAVGVESVGRVTAMWLMAFLGGRVVYSFAGGWVADTLSPLAFVLMGAASLCLASLMASRLCVSREAGRLQKRDARGTT